MLTDQQTKLISFNIQDLKSFKNLLLGYVLSKALFMGILFLGGSAISAIIPLVVGWFGTVLLIYGIFSISRKYKELASGFKIVYLFLSALIADIGTNLYVYFVTIPTVDQNSSNADIVNALNQFYLIFTIVAIITLITGILILLTSYYFTEWFNEISKFRPTKSYFYYGIVFCLGQAILAAGFYIFGSVLKGVANGQYSTTIDVNNAINSANNILNIGSLIVFIAYIAEIIAGVMIYNRVNDLAMGKMHPMFYPPPYYANPYQFNPYQPQNPNQGNPYQPPYPNQPPNPYQNNPYQSPNPYQGNPYQPYSNPYQQNPQPSQDQTNNDTIPTSREPENTFGNDSSNDKISCDNCGTKLPPNTRFCYKCGYKIGP